MFTKDLTEVKDSLLPSKMPAAVRVDAVAPCGITMQPRTLVLEDHSSKLRYPTDISRGDFTTEILRDMS